jgi:hypothetical protein
VPLRFVVNGYFRSGTTVVWDIIRRCNPDLVCLYEPCHENLGVHLDHDRGVADPLHGADLWADYRRLTDAHIVGNLVAQRRDLVPRYPLDAGDVSEYVSMLHAEPRQMMAKVNRWHFVLGELQSRFGYQTVHVIRRPQAVFDSMRNAYRRQGSRLAQLVKRTGLVDHRAFNLRRYYDGVAERANALGWERPARTGVGDFEAFLATWLLANLAACQSVHDGGGLLFSYERLLRDPSSVADGFRDLGLRFVTDNVLRPVASAASLTDGLSIHGPMWERLGLESQAASLHALLEGE